ncbi:hypothetical protein DIPPA_17285 [Diplonema papillatum]|nr:hypothetical protein DIPPA_17285 [Diplonema papillatum]KAJ9450838.1 hypothetical protein DIPPA_17285 [Diplonema papillatum]
MNAKRRSGVLALYRATLKQAKLLPKDDRISAMDQVRSGYRERQHMTDAEEVTASIRDGFSRLGYLRTVTPRVDVRGRREQKEKTKFVMGAGASVVEGASERRTKGQVLRNEVDHDPEARSRLRYHLDVNHFKGDYWKGEKPWVPSWCRPVEAVVNDAYEYHKGVDHVPDAEKLARNSHGSKHGVLHERARYTHAPWDITDKGSDIVHR